MLSNQFHSKIVRYTSVRTYVSTFHAGLALAAYLEYKISFLPPSFLLCWVDGWIEAASVYIISILYCEYRFTY